MSKASFWIDTVNTGLKEAYRGSKEVVVFCNGIGNAQLPVITFFISKCQYCCFPYVD